MRVQAPASPAAGRPMAGYASWGRAGVYSSAEFLNHFHLTGHQNEFLADMYIMLAGRGESLIIEIAL